VARDVTLEERKDFGLGDRKAVNEHETSTAALDPISQRIFLLQRHASCHPASGLLVHEVNAINF
jgi:hypothetical protein